MNFEGQHLLAIGDLTKEDLLKVIEVAGEIDKDMEKYKSLLNGKIVSTLFFEPSTRTRMSFQASMERMGGSIIGFSDVSTSSLQKGESLPDTIKIISGYCDVIVMRHPEAGSVAKAAEDSSVPVINAGDGPNEHPTQTILDLYTIMKEKGTLEGLKVGFVGDLRFGRTVHSLAMALTHFNPEFYFISPPSLAMPEKYLQELIKKGIKYRQEEDLLKVSKELDVLYVTRIQKERFVSPEEYAKVKGIYKLDKSLAQHIKEDAKILHPLPRVDEMNPELDELPQSIYFQQAHNGIPVRMALLGLVLGKLK
ncbi:aspartate carbamoyltransferase [Candidatus Woesearchaeota archaeon]|nr:aspartate carbamoyltransferase [Candidatus Woesearchaeota archaeon]|tara:strand:+ start:5321 stop:6244 length:924 start_codon:yes stop_codon:yes gene_type:complete